VRARDVDLRGAFQDAAPQARVVGPLELRGVARQRRPPVDDRRVREEDVEHRRVTDALRGDAEVLREIREPSHERATDRPHALVHARLAQLCERRETRHRRHRVAVASGSWGDRRLSLAGYVAGTEEGGQALLEGASVGCPRAIRHGAARWRSRSGQVWADDEFRRKPRVPA